MLRLEMVCMGEVRFSVERAIGGRMRDQVEEEVTGLSASVGPGVVAEVSRAYGQEDVAGGQAR